nr:hypothetical protein [Kitasatospora fiedleri]
MRAARAVRAARLAQPSCCSIARSLRSSESSFGIDRVSSSIVRSMLDEYEEELLLLDA